MVDKRFDFQCSESLLLPYIISYMGFAIKLFVYCLVLYIDRVRECNTAKEEQYYSFGYYVTVEVFAMKLSLLPS